MYRSGSLLHTSRDLEREKSPWKERALNDWQRLLKATDAPAELNREDGSALKDAIERQGGGGSGDAVRLLERGLLRGVYECRGERIMRALKITGLRFWRYQTDECRNAINLITGSRMQ